MDDDELLRKPLMSSPEGSIRYPEQPLHPATLRYLLESGSYESMVFTSRNTRVAQSSATSHENIIEVEPMNEAEALGLLQKKLKAPGMNEDMMQLVRALELMPLAILPAASYITYRSPRYSLSQYIEKVQKGDRHAVRLPNTEAGLLYRDWEAAN